MHADLLILVAREGTTDDKPGILPEYISEAGSESVPPLTCNRVEDARLFHCRLCAYAFIVNMSELPSDVQDWEVVSCIRIAPDPMNKEKPKPYFHT